MTTSPREALERLTRWRDWDGRLTAGHDLEEFAATVKGLLSTVEQMREALTDRNQRLTDVLNTTVQEATTAIDDRLKPEIKRLAAENARLTSENARLQVEMESAYGDLTNSLMTGFSHGRPTAKELEERIQRAKSALEGAVFGGAGNWYTRHRSQVEAAHAAKRNAWPRYCRHEGQDIRPAIAAHEEAKDDADEAEGLRPLTDDEIEAGSYLLTRAKTGGIDMDLLGDLCREEPDEAAKQAVAEMMDGLNGGKEGRQ